MAMQGVWEADKMLDVYIYDFLKKRNLEQSAKAFLSESKLCSETVAIDAPGGFLLEWWSIFWDVFMVRSGQKHSEIAASYVETQQLKNREQRLQMQQSKQLRQRMQRSHLQGMPAGISLNGVMSPGVSPQGVPLRGGGAVLRQPNTMSADAFAKKSLSQRDPMGSHGYVDGARLNSLANNDMPAHGMSNQTLNPSIFGVTVPTGDDHIPGLVSSPSFMTQAGDSSLMQPLTDLDWPATPGQRRQLMPNQSVRPFGHPSPQYHQIQQALSPQMQQQVYGQNQTGSQRMLMARSGLVSDGRDGLHTGGGNDFSQGAGNSPSTSQGSPDNRKMFMHKMSQMQQPEQHQSSTVSQQQTFQRQLQLQRDKLSGVGATSQNGRKRKQEPASSSGPANSLGTVNTNETASPSPNSDPSPQSAGLSMSQQQLQSQLGIGSPSIANQMGFCDGEDGNGADPHVDSYLQPGTIPADTTMVSKQSPPLGASVTAEVNPTPRFSFREVGCLRASTSKVLSCHFSSDGTLLASAGHDKKVNLWNMGTLKLEHTLEEHLLLITDVRFSPTSTRLATCSFDKTVRVWEVGNPAYSLRTFQGHATSVMSLDFHPNNEDLLCSCDGDSEIRYWSVSQGICIKSFKGGVTQLRFQPTIGRFLAAAAENVVSIFDVESESAIHCLLNHTKPVHSLCWSDKGDILASLTEDYVRVWAIGSTNIEGGERSKCIHELGCNGKKFHSCVFHPNYPSLLVIGCYQSMELWNMVENKSMTVTAHEALIASLVSSTTGLVASASHDKCVKLWQ